jgi:dipeptidyl aminopeptidase/acylaminoacyl peptidase
MFTRSMRLRRSFWLMLALGSWNALAVAAQAIRYGAVRDQPGARPISVADAIEMTKLADESYFLGGPGTVAHFSPDGKKFVIVVRKGNVEQDTNEYSVLLYRVSAAFDAPKADVLLTMSTSSAYRGAISQLRWFDNDTLSFLGETPTEGSQVYTFNISARVLRKITHHPTSIQTYDMTRDGREFIFSADAPAVTTTDKERRSGIIITTQPLYALLAGDPYPDPELFLQRAGDGVVQIPVNGRINFTGPISISPNGRYAVIATWPRFVPAEWAGYQDATIKERISSHFQGSLSPIPTYLLLDTDHVSLVPLVNAPMRNFNKFVWAPDSKSIFLKTYLPLDVQDPVEREMRSKAEASIELNLVTRAPRRIEEEELKRQLARNEESQSPLIVTLEENANLPPRIYVSNASSKRRTLLLDLNPQFAGLVFGKVENISWKTAEGYEFEGGLYLPPAWEAGKRYPLVIQTHGFTSTRFSMDGTAGDWSSAYAARMLAAKDMIVAQMGAPKDPAFEKFTNTEMEGPKEMSSIDGLIDSLTERGLVDSSRVGISGFSRTVYAVGYTLTHSDRRFRAATLVDGIGGSYFDYLAWGNTGSVEDDAKINGGRPFGQNLQSWLKSSPGFNLDKVNAPVRVVALNKGSLLGMWQWFIGLFLQNKPVELVEIPEGVHALKKPSQRRIAMQGMVDWFSFWQKGEEDPDPAKAEQYARWRELRKLQETSSAEAKVH